MTDTPKCWGGIVFPAQKILDFSTLGLTMQLTGGVSVLERVYAQKADISNNFFVKLTIALCAEPYDKRYFVSSNMTLVICRKCKL